MRHVLLVCCALMLAVAGASANVITMEPERLSYDYPEGWLVLSAQRCGIYAPLLTDMGLDADVLEEEMETQGVVSRAVRGTDESYSIYLAEDELSQDIFQMEKITEEQKRRIRSRAENNSLWERTGLRAQNAEWQSEAGRMWLFVNYTEMRGNEVLSRGLRYTTIYNGHYVSLDWRITGRRFGNKDLTAFRRKLSGLVFTEEQSAPRRAVRVICEIPEETGASEGVLQGTADPGAVLTLSAEDGKGNCESFGSSTADGKGTFSIAYSLPREGEWTMTLSAEAEGFDPFGLTQVMVYNESALPVSGIPETVTATDNKTVISGKTLPGASMQLISPSGLTKKRAANDGTFSFELTTKETGSADYTLIVDKKGYTQRRVRFTVVRELTDEQQRAAVRAKGVRVAYGNLTRDLEKNRGAVLNLTGYVTDVSRAGSTCYVRMMYTKNEKGEWSNPVILVTSGDVQAHANDLLTCTVEIEGVDEEQDARGETVYVPRMRILFIDKVE